MKKYINSSKEYKTNDGKIHITPSSKTYEDIKEEYPIFIEETNINECDGFVQFSFEQAKEICEFLTEIIYNHENGCSLTVGDKVIIVDGAFKGIKGTVIDIDNIANENELTIQVPESKNNDQIYLYIDISNVELI